MAEKKKAKARRNAGNMSEKKGFISRARERLTLTREQLCDFGCRVGRLEWGD